ncbi:TonB-dependent receptor [hydrothermal vent metagenome]|uniref:TonB-dependent receptor n=1 Tax=hydrothermal vent metagenome TaxID=652676 RepID=A0A3B0S5E0_9ZZZZ
MILAGTECRAQAEYKGTTKGNMDKRGATRRSDLLKPALGVVMHYFSQQTTYSLKQKLMASATGLALIGASGLPSAALAQQQGGGVTDQIIVTAQKRDQSIQDVGIAITAYSGVQLKKLGVETSIDIINLTPGVSMAGDIGGQRALFNIRGVVQNDFADLAEAPVAVYVDDGYLASTQAQTFGLYDIDRVEVLKGPQGTLFGRNATGGLVHTLTKRPTRDFEAYADISGGSFNFVRGEAAVSGPISDVVSARVSVLYNNFGEILENVYPGVDAQGRTGTPGGGQNGYNDDTFAIRGQLQFDFSDNASLLLTGNFSDTTKSEGPYQGIGSIAVIDSQGRHINTLRAQDTNSNCEAISAETGDCINLFADGDTDGIRPVVGGDLFGNLDPDGNDRQVNKDFAFDDENKIKSEGLAAKFTLDAGWGTLTSISDYKHFERSISLDSDQSATPLALFQSDGNIDQFSQEIRLNGETERTTWVAGVYYLNVKTDMTQGLAYPENSPFLVGFPQIILGLPGVVFDPFEDNTTAKLQTNSYSVFGQADFQLSDTLTLVTGLRGVIEEKDYTQVIGEFANTDDRVIETATSTGFVPRAPFASSTSDFLWSGKLQLEYSPDADHLYYIGVNRGVKAGSFNAKLFDGVTLSDAEIPYKEEVLYSYEAGFKATFADGKTRLNGSIYYYDYNDYQAFTWSSNSGFVTNNDATYKGAELELLTSPAQGWDIIANVAYIDAVVKDLEFAPGLTKDVTPSFTPEFTASGTVRYAWPGFGGELAAQSTVSYQSSVFNNMRNFTGQKFDGWAEVNARFSWESDDGSWGTAVAVSNLFDSRHGVIGFDVSSFGGYTQESYARPRWISVNIRKNF